MPKSLRMFSSFMAVGPGLNPAADTEIFASLLRTESSTSLKFGAILAILELVSQRQRELDQGISS